MGSIRSWLQIDSIPERRLSLPVPGTCAWLLETSEWHSWRRGANPAPLILTGPPGSGKSTLAYFVCRELNNASPRPVLSYFFDAVQGRAFCTAQAFLIGILGQLYRRHPNRPRHAFSIFKDHQADHKTIWECPVYKLLRLVEQALASSPCYYLVVDSLDESGEEWEILHDFLVRLSTREGVAVMITCRSDASSVPLGCNALKLQYYSAELHTDLCHFAESEVDTKMHLRTPELFKLRRQVIESIARSATFLHARLLIDLLKELKTPKQIKDTMSKHGPKLSKELYLQLLHDSEKKLSHSPEQLARQKRILQLLVAAQEPLSLDQIAEFLATDQSTVDFSEEELSLHIRQEVEELCGSFISISDSARVTFFHMTAKTFFESHAPTTLDKSNLYLALRCLAVLSQDEYKDVERATQLLRQHLKPSDPSEDLAAPSRNSPIYKYAALYVHQHIVAVAHPPQELLSRLKQFLQGVEFITWSESVLDFKPGAGYATQIDFRASLSSWIDKLPPADQEEINFDLFFEAPHVQLSKILKDTAKDKILQFLPRIRLGEFWNAAAQSTNDLQKGYVQKGIVYDGLKELLKPKDRFLLQARTSLLQEYFWQKRFAEVLPELQELYKLQKEIGQSGNDIFTTAWLLGAAWLALGHYEQAEIVLTDTLEQVRRLRGERDRFFNMLLLLDGQRLERVNDLEKAAAKYDAALSTMTEISGPQNLFVLTLKTALGAIFRKQNRYEGAEELLFEGYAGRSKINSINVNACFDGAMQLATLYRDKGNGAECKRLLDSIKHSAVRHDDFERQCQFIHIDSLVEFDQGGYVVPKYRLMELIDSASGKDRAKNNRELLWTRIDLADAMRSHDESDEALMLFSDLVVPTETTEPCEIHEEPESPRQLAVAERALRLVRNAEFAESERLLQDNNLRWFREADFYFSIQGGPTLDTSIIHPLRT